MSYTLCKQLHAVQTMRIAVALGNIHDKRVRPVLSLSCLLVATGDQRCHLDEASLCREPKQTLAGDVVDVIDPTL